MQIEKLLESFFQRNIELILKEKRLSDYSIDFHRTNIIESEEHCVDRRF